MGTATPAGTSATCAVGTVACERSSPPSGPAPRDGSRRSGGGRSAGSPPTSTTRSASGSWPRLNARSERLPSKTLREFARGFGLGSPSGSPCRLGRSPEHVADVSWLRPLCQREPSQPGDLSVSAVWPRWARRSDRSRGHSGSRLGCRKPAKRRRGGFGKPIRAGGNASRSSGEVAYLRMWRSAVPCPPAARLSRISANVSRSPACWHASAATRAGGPGRRPIRASRRSRV
jgi:hypothetical protein